MAMRYPGGFISATAPTVSANSAKGIWTLEEAMQYVRAGTWPVPTGNGDPFFQYNTMLLPGQGTNGAQNNTFLDSSTNNFTITRNGNTTQGTFSPFSGANGYWGMYNSGSSYLSIADNAAFNLSGTPFTIEAWVYHVADSGAYTNWVVGKRGTGSPFTSVWALSISSTNFVEFGTTGYTWGITSSFPIQRNTWNHIAGTYDGTSVRLYVNGVLAAGPTAATVSDVGAAVTIGNYTVGANPVFTGYISNLRIVKGTAVYTSNFTPSTTPLTSISGTSLLTCQSNRFVDNSTNAFAITVNSTPQITPFQPFGAPTSAYSASTIGGSGYFDGTSDYLTATANNAFNFGTGDFTVEGWIYPVATGGMGIWGNGPASSGSFGIAINASNKLQMDYYGGTSLAGATNVPANAWSYFAFVRTGSTLNVYLNGVRDGTTTTSSNNSTNDFVLGRSWTNFTSGELNGYVSGFRVSDAYARYTGTTMTVPTAPLTNDGNTSVLLNFTNAGIIDNAQKNDLETVGNAQISTTQYKWGASSMYFDGTSDYLKVPSSQNLVFNTGDFTLETWIYLTATGASDGAIIDLRGSGATSTGFAWTTRPVSGGYKLNFYTDSAANLGSTTISYSTWNHVVVTRTAGTVKMYVNGNLDMTVAKTNNFSDAPVVTIGESTLYSGSNITGYLADFRATKGYARYPYNFTAPTAAFPLFWQAAATPSADPYFEYTTLLLPGNGTNGAQNNTFLDSSANAFTITRNGNTTQGTFTPFSQTGWGNYFDGSGDYLSLASNAAFDFGTGDFTVEAFVYLTGNSPLDGSSRRIANIFSVSSSTFNFNFVIRGDSSTTGTGLEIYNGTSVVNVTGTISQNAWNHLAVSKSGSSVYFWLNGTQLGSTQTGVSGSWGSSSVGAQVGRSTVTSFTFDLLGYMSNVRVVKGTALYTSAFTVPTTNLTAVTNTQLLTCQSNRFVDNSTNAFTITRNGDTSVQAFSPFNPTAAYSTSTVGGSGYFDGSGDYLTIPSDTAFNFGTGAFSVEFWVYITSLAENPSLINTNSTTIFYEVGGSNRGLCLFASSASQLTSATTVLPIGAWSHVVVCRNSSGNLSSFVNGTRLDTKTSNTSTIDFSGAIINRYFPSSGGHLFGYTSSLRLIKGSTPYDPTSTTITVPTAPVTNITNTSLLLNFTNGGIIDNTAKNNLETVGGASISTTVSKFGGSSMYFDGAGDSLIVPNSQNFDFGSGDFTVEVWVYPTASGAYKGIFTKRESGANYSPVQVLINSGTMALFVSTSGSSWAINTNASSSPALNTWSHIAVCRYGGTITLYLNGASVASGSVSTSSLMTNTARFVFGSESATDSGNYAGYMQDARVTKGIARYTQNFTPPTTAFLTL